MILHLFCTVLGGIIELKSRGVGFQELFPASLWTYDIIENGAKEIHIPIKNGNFLLLPPKTEYNIQKGHIMPEVHF